MGRLPCGTHRLFRAAAPDAARNWRLGRPVITLAEPAAPAFQCVQFSVAQNN